MTTDRSKSPSTQDQDLGTRLPPERDQAGKPGSYHNDPNGQKGPGPQNDEKK